MLVIDVGKCVLIDRQSVNKWYCLLNKAIINSTTVYFVEPMCILRPMARHIIGGYIAFIKMMFAFLFLLTIPQLVVEGSHMMAPRISRFDMAKDAKFQQVDQYMIFYFIQKEARSQIHIFWDTWIAFLFSGHSNIGSDWKRTQEGSLLWHLQGISWMWRGLH